MNIFVTDLDPVQSAKNLDDKRVKHMGKEYVEMLGAYVHSTTGLWMIPFPLWGNDERNEPLFLYNHPVTRWVRKDKANAYWLVRHTVALFEENLYRGFELPAVASFMMTLMPIIGTSDAEPKYFQNSSINKHAEITVAYRETMIKKWTITDKIKPAKFTRRGAPWWFPQQENLNL